MFSEQEFAKRLKDKYPEYRGVDDTELVARTLEKYPQYHNQVNFANPQLSEKSTRYNLAYGATKGVAKVAAFAGKGLGHLARILPGDQSNDPDSLLNRSRRVEGDLETMDIIARQRGFKPESLSAGVGEF